MKQKFMKEKKIYLLLLFVVFGCSREVVYNTNLIRIIADNPDNNTSLFRAIADYKYIKLETTPECLINRIDKLLYAHNRYYILDAKISSIFVFDHTGKFLLKIFKQGDGPDEYNYLMDFDVDKQGNIYVLDLYKKNIIKYSSKGLLLNKYPQEYFSQNLIVVDTATFLTYQGSTFQSTMNGRLIFRTKDKILNSFMPFNEKVNEINLLKPFSLYRSQSILYNKDLSDTIYEVSLNGLQAKYFIDFGSFSIKPELRERPKAFMAGSEKIQEGFRINNFFETKNYFTCSFNLKAKSWILYYSKKDRKYTITFCPGCGEPQQKIISDFVARAVQDDYFISVLNYRYIKIYKEGIEKGNSKMLKFLGSENVNLVKSLGPNDNPVLVLYKLKEFSN